METIKKNAKSIAIGAGIVAAAVGVFLLLKRSSKKAIPGMKPLTENEKTTIINQLQISYNGQYLRPSSIAQISEAMRKFASAEYVRLNLESRKVRRANKKNFTLYVKTMEDCLNQLDRTSRVSEVEVLSRLGIPEATWIQSLEYYYNQGEPTVVNLQTTFSEAQAKEMPRNKILTMEQYKAALIRNTELLATERFNVQNVMRMVNNQAYTGLILYNKINDIIFEELGVEDEDFALAMATYAPELSDQDSTLIEKYLQAAGNLGV